MWTTNFSLWAEDLMTSAQKELDDAWEDMKRSFRNLEGIGVIKTRGSFPKLRVWESPSAYIIKATVPGYSKEQIEVKASDDTVVGIYLAKQTSEASLLNEIPSYACTRHVEFPEPIKADGIVAKLTDGILTLEIPKVNPKKEEPKETKIEIN